MKFLLIIALVVVLVAVVLMLLRPSGPRVTRIEHRRETGETDERRDGDGRKDGDA